MTAEEAYNVSIQHHLNVFADENNSRWTQVSFETERVKNYEPVTRKDAVFCRSVDEDFLNTEILENLFSIAGENWFYDPVTENGITFYFKDPKHAMHFKLTFI